MKIIAGVLGVAVVLLCACTAEGYLCDEHAPDPETGSGVWTKKADFAGGERYGAVGFSIDNRGYMGTGLTDPSTNTYLNDFWEYNPVSNTWSQKADFPGEGRQAAVGFSIGNKGYIGTGSGSPYLQDFWEFTP